MLQQLLWQEVIQKMVNDGEKSGLSGAFVEKVFKAIHQESIQHQEKIVNS